METKNMLYLVTEYAKNGEIFGKYFSLIFLKFENVTCLCECKYFLLLSCLFKSWYHELEIFKHWNITQYPVS